MSCRRIDLRLLHVYISSPMNERPYERPWSRPELVLFVRSLLYNCPGASSGKTITLFEKCDSAIFPPRPGVEIVSAQRCTAVVTEYMHTRACHMALNPRMALPWARQPKVLRAALSTRSKGEKILHGDKEKIKIARDKVDMSSPSSYHPDHICGIQCM